jgi:hypothetical protein
MNIVVIDVPDAWGMLLSRSWSATLGGFLSMDLTHAHIPMGDGHLRFLYSQHVVKNHVMDPNHPNYHSDCEYDVAPHIIEYDPSDFPFAQEDCIDTLLPKTDKYKEKLAKYQGKDPGPSKYSRKMKIRKIKSEKKLSRDMVKAGPPTQPYIEDIPYVEFDEGSLALMWDKRKGKPKYDKKSEVLWLGPYIVNKKSEKGTYYLSSMDGRKMPLPVDGSIL